MDIASNKLCGMLRNRSIQHISQAPQVNQTTLITPEPSYPNITKQSLALLDVYVTTFISVSEYLYFDINFRGTNGLFGPYQDVSRIFDAMEGARLVDADGEGSLIVCLAVNLSRFSSRTMGYAMRQ